MRIERRVLSVGWIPSEAVSGPFKLLMDRRLGAHYDNPPPSHIDDLEPLRAADEFRFANELRAFAEFDGAGTPTAWGYTGGLAIGVSEARLGPVHVAVAAVGMPDIQAEPEVGPSWVRFVQTSGGRTGFPMPRFVLRPPWFRLRSPLVWSTLELTVHADGRCEHRLVGASPFPRHWVYDDSGEIVAKVGVANWHGFMTQSSWRETPWGNQDSPALVAAAESALERELSRYVMHGDVAPRISTVARGDAIVRQGDPGSTLFLVLDGVARVEVDGKVLGDLGPGAILGERAILEGTARTATVTALSDVRLAGVPADAIDRARLEELAAGHRREQGS